MNLSPGHSHQQGPGSAKGEAARSFDKSSQKRFLGVKGGVKTCDAPTRAPVPARCWFCGCKLALGTGRDISHSLSRPVSSRYTVCEGKDLRELYTPATNEPFSCCDRDGTSLNTPPSIGEALFTRNRGDAAIIAPLPHEHTS